MAWFIFNQNIVLNALSFHTAFFCSQLFKAYEFHQMLYDEKIDSIFRIKNTHVLLKTRFVLVAIFVTYPLPLCEPPMSS